MPRFEYHQETVPAGEAFDSKKLDELGEERWELVTSYKTSEYYDDMVEGRNLTGYDHYTMFVFKRETN